MFFSVPISKQVITKTPLGMRQVTHLFFENKNGGAFKYKREADNVTILIDGKMVCRQVPILPFMSSTTFGVNRYKWQDVALEIGLNVNMSEIKISADAVNDYNVVFVCSEEENHDYKGFDFVECKRFKVRENITNEQAIEMFSAANWPTKAEYDEYVAEFKESLTTGEAIFHEHTLYNKDGIEFKVNMPIVATRDRQTFEEIDTETAMIKSVSGDMVDEYGYWVFPYSDPLKYHAIYLLKSYVNDQKRLFKWNTEYTISTDRGAQRMFMWQTKTTETAPAEMKTNDAVVYFSLSGSENEELPGNTDLSVVGITDLLSWRKNVHEFSERMPRALQLQFDIPDSQKTIEAEKDVITWDIYVFLIYKKII